MQREAAGGMARGMALKPRGKEARVFFITLSRRWWRGVLLGLLIVGGGWLALTLEREGGVQRGGVAPLPEETLQDAWPAAAFPALAPSPAVPAAPTAGLPTVQVTAVRSHPFDELRLERERQRSRQAELLQSLAQDATVSEERRMEAHQQLLALWTLEAREQEVEQLLRAQGVTSVVVLSAHGAHVVVDGLLDQTAAARIGELVHRVAGVPREGITIVDGILSGR